MTKKLRIPKFQLQNVYADGSRDEPELHALNGIDAKCRMGRRGFLLTSAIGAGALAALTGCVTTQPTNTAHGQTAQSTRAASPPPPDVAETKASKTHGIIAHRESVRYLAFSPDSKTLLSAAEDVKFWSVPGGKLQKTLKEFRVSLLGTGLSADGKTLATNETDGRVLFWPAPFAKPDAEVRTNVQKPESLALSPDGKLIALISTNVVRLLSAPSGQELATLTHDTQVDGLAFSPDSKTLASAEFAEGAVSIWSVPEGKRRTRWNCRADTLAFSADGTLLGCAYSGTLQLCDVPSGAIRKTLDHMQPRRASLAFSPDGKWLAAAARFSTILILPAPFLEPALRLTDHEGDVRSLAFSKNGRFLAAGTDSGKIYLWEISSKTMGYTLRTILIDTAVTRQDVSVRQAVMGKESVYVGKCGDPLPPGAVCTCNCVSGRYVQPAARPAPARTSGGSYCTCNKICTCVPIK